MQQQEEEIPQQLYFPSQQQVYYYNVAPGNNSQAVIKVMQKRKFWIQSDTKPNFQWSQSDKHFKYLTLSKLQMQVVNHLPNHRELSMKCNLIQNLVNYCAKNQRYVWDITPVSFIVDFARNQDFSRAIKSFKIFYDENLPGKFKEKSSISKYHNKFVQPRMHPSMMDDEQHYIWILKPNSLNRGRGIQFFKTIEELKSICDEGLNEYQFSKGKVQSSQFVIQKYIQKPLLLDGRKFDIRIWVLVTHTFDIYIYNQGYARLSSEMFDMDQLDAFIHLTNNAVQKHSSHYGLLELGNQMSYSELDYYTHGKFTKTILPKIKSMIVFTWMSVQQTFQKYKYSFEIFGYDFMIDENLKPWLIEINTNPCLEESSPLLQELIPKMLDDAFKIVIDPLVNKQFENTGWEHLLQL